MVGYSAVFRSLNNNNFKHFEGTKQAVICFKPYFKEVSFSFWPSLQFSILKLMLHALDSYYIPVAFKSNTLSYYLPIVVIISTFPCTHFLDKLFCLQWTNY